MADKDELTPEMLAFIERMGTTSAEIIHGLTLLPPKVARDYLVEFTCQALAALATAQAEQATRKAGE
jgi:hypothetical protein